MSQLTQDTLKSLLSYDPDTGVFTWLVDRTGGLKAGAKAGTCTGRGYIHISIYGQQYKAHRLAWLYTHGAWPENEIDHINHDVGDNRLSNLRSVTRSQNMQNIRKEDKGLEFKRRRWRARISINKKCIFLGYFDTKEDAIAARKAAELEYHTHRIDDASSHLQRRRRTEADGDPMVGAGQE